MNYKYQITQEGGFRCEVGDHVRPLSQLRMQDGQPVCVEHRDELSPLEAQLALAESIALGAQHNDFARRWPSPAFLNPFAGVPAITAIAPPQLLIARSGPSGSLTLTGVNFAATDVITVDSARLTLVASVDSSTSITLTVSAAFNATAGLHAITYNGQVLRGLVRVT